MFADSLVNKRAFPLGALKAAQVLLKQGAAVVTALVPKITRSTLFLTFLTFLTQKQPAVLRSTLFHTYHTPTQFCVYVRNCVSVGAYL